MTFWKFWGITFSIIGVICFLGWINVGDIHPLMILIFVVAVVFFLVTLWEHITFFKPSKEPAPIEFYNECKKQGITKISTASERAKVILIAQEMGISESQIDEFLQAGRTRDEKAIVQKKEKEFNEARAKEEETRNELNKYSGYFGREKRIAMLTEQLHQAENKAAEMKKFQSGLISSSQQKEHDWAAIGGAVSGIAGGAAGVSAALDAQVKNQKIREQNEANLHAVAPMVWWGSDEEKKYLEIAERLRNEINNAKFKLVSEDSAEKLFRLLIISNVKTKISPTNAVTITATVQKPQKLLIYEDTPAVIDGTIIGDLVVNDRVVDTFYLVLPLYGVGESSVSVTGMSLRNTKPDSQYEVRFRPYKLWAMER